MRAPIELRIHDADVSIWQENPHDRTFREEIYGGLIRELRARGWTVHADPRTRQHYRVLSPNTRTGARGTLRFEMSLSGRVVEVKFWSTTAVQENRNGRLYDFDRLRRMQYLDRCRVELEFRRIEKWLTALAPLTLKRSVDRYLPPLERIARGYAESVHSDKQLGRPVCDAPYNKRSGDGAEIEQGQTVWFPDSKGRICRGRAYYNINSMWFVVAGSELFNLSCGQLYCQCPADLRRKRNDRDRRRRVERELELAVRRMDYLRADLLKRILWGDAKIYMIWSRKRDAYYRAQYAGYTSDSTSAGKYTLAEAEAECRRVPHFLSMVDENGVHTRFDEEAA